MILAWMLAAALSASAEYAEGQRQARKSDFGSARTWFERAAHDGAVGANYDLGAMYEHGLGVAPNAKRAFKYYLQGARAGDRECMAAAGRGLALGEGTAPAPVEGLKWLRRAAAKGSLQAEFALGWCSAKGLGVPQSYREAVGWFRKAADGGYAEAQAVLGDLYWRGLGVASDPLEAYVWYYLAAHGHVQGADKAVAEIATHLSARQIEACKAKADAIWKRALPR